MAKCCNILCRDRPYIFGIFISNPVYFALITEELSGIFDPAKKNRIDTAIVIYIPHEKTNLIFLQ